MTALIVALAVVIFGPPVLLGTFVRIGRRPRGLLLRLWWWYGYHTGLYWTSGRLQAFGKFRNGTRRRCSCGRWTHVGGDLRGVRCAKPELHVGKCRMVIDP